MIPQIQAFLERFDQVDQDMAEEMKVLNEQFHPQFEPIQAKQAELIRQKSELEAKLLKARKAYDFPGIASTQTAILELDVKIAEIGAEYHKVSAALATAGLPYFERARGAKQALLEEAQNYGPQLMGEYHQMMGQLRGKYFDAQRRHDNHREQVSILVTQAPSGLQVNLSEAKRKLSEYVESLP